MYGVGCLVSLPPRQRGSSSGMEAVSACVGLGLLPPVACRVSHDQIAPHTKHARAQVGRNKIVDADMRFELASCTVAAAYLVSAIFGQNLASGWQAAGASCASDSSDTTIYHAISSYAGCHACLPRMLSSRRGLACMCGSLHREHLCCTCCVGWLTQRTFSILSGDSTPWLVVAGRSLPYPTEGYFIFSSCLACFT